MFHFPAFPPHSLCVQLRVIRHNTVRGFPIRKSWSQRPVIDSTRLIADSHVLLRLPMPRHPPCALKNLTTNMIKNLHELKILQSKEPRKTHPKVCSPGSIIHKKLLMQNKTKTTSNPKDYQPIFILLHKMLASTIQFPNNNPITPTTTHHPKVNHVRLRPCAGNPEKTKPPTTTPPQGSITANGPVISGPNSVPKTTHQQPHHFPTPKGAYSQHNHQPSSHHLLIFHP